MYAVLLVDDEPGHLIGLTKLLRRLRPDYSVRTAKNGKDALTLCEAADFQIIITDIQMPLMDGLHFVAQLPEGRQPRRIIYLTGYNYFEYAQQAIGLGTFDYVLKPVDIDKFMVVLDRAEQSLEKEYHRLREQAMMAAQLESAVPVYRKRILTDWLLDKPLPNEAWIELTASVGIPQEGCLIVCELHRTGNVHEQNKAALLDDIQFRLHAHFGENHNGCLAFDPDHDRDMIVCLLSSVPDEWELEAGASLLRELPPGHAVRLGMSSRSSQLLKDAPRLYREAREACEEGFYTEDRFAFRYRSTKFEMAYPLVVDPRDEVMLTEALHKNAGQLELAAAVDTVINRHLRKGHYPKPAVLAETMVRLLCRIADAAEFVGPDTRAQLIADIQAAAASHSLCDLRQAAADRLADIASAISIARKGHKEHVIHDCLAYIDEHYMNDLSLESVAAVFHFNASYFSQYFKSKLNVNFSQYLTQLRLTKAKELLEQSGDRVYQVAERLGYHDVKYFNRLFKKEFGLTPEEYRTIARRMKQAKP